MNLSSLTALSPIDGRYHKKTAELRPIFSEYGLIHYRLYVEIMWLLFLATHAKLPELKPLSASAARFLLRLHENFNEEEAEQIKAIEKHTNHDIKAIEYYLKDKFDEVPELSECKEYIHFACTSDDINNTAYALMLAEARKSQLLPAFDNLLRVIRSMVEQYTDAPMLARTHGQPASPTTMGKELANFVARLQRQTTDFGQQSILAKWNGAVGNFNAHSIAYPELDWPLLCKTFIQSLNLTYNPLTTQIEPHDYIAEYLHHIQRINTILIDFSRDIWGYISLGYFKLRHVHQEVGSSTMPHKINPIDFENAEGNLALANALLGFLADRLPISRFQRDLVDSTLLRNMGVALAHSLIAYKAIERGLGKLDLDASRLEADLNDHWEILTEAIQTVMRRYNMEAPYEQLKQLSRGSKVDQAKLLDFIESLSLPEAAKQQLKALSPKQYLGLASQLSKIS